MDALTADLLIAKLKPMFVREPASLKPPVARNTRTLLLQLTKDIGPLFIVLDDFGRAFDDGTMTDLEKRDKFYSFCSHVLGDWLYMKVIFFLVAGRGTFFSYVRQRGLDQHFAQFERIELLMLRKEDIKVILTKTAVKASNIGNTIAKHFDLDEEEIEKAATILYTQTHGHPRSLVRAFGQCLTKQDLLHLEQQNCQWDHLDKEFYTTLLPYRNALLTLLNAAEANEIAEKNDSMHTFNLTRSTPSVNGLNVTYHLVVSKACILWEGEVTAARLRVHPLLKSYLEHWFLPFQTYVIRIADISRVSIDYANSFEWMCLKRLQEIFFREHQPDIALPEFFSTPKFGSCTNAKFSSFTFEMPKVTSRAQSEATIDSATASPEDIKRLQLVVNDTVCYKPKPKFASPDLLLFTTAQYKDKSVKLVCGLTAKNYSRTGLTKTQINKEIERFNRLLDKRNDNELRVLFVCCTNYSEELKSQFNRDGKWFNVYHVPAQYQNTDEVILLNLQSSQQKQIFFGVSDAVLKAVDEVIKKTEVELQSNEEAQ